MIAINKRQFLTAGMGLAAGLATGFRPALARSGGIKLGFAPWADAEFITRLAAKLIEDKLDTKVELIQTDVAPLYQGVTRGDVDAMLMCWLPKTHEDYYKRVEGKVERLGTLYTDAKLGWVVPKYVPESELASIEDLAKPAVQEKLGGRIQGIEPGAGLTRLSQDTLKAYGLNGYQLQEASEAAMISMVNRQMRGKNWVVATAWSPHWMFGKYELRYLADPRGALGAAEEVVGLGRPGLKKERPEVAAFLSKLNLPLNELEAAMLVAQEDSVDAAVSKYIDEHGQRVNGWFAA